MYQDKYFKTTNFYLASFLFAKGLELVNIDKITDSKRAFFVFIDSPEREIYLEAFNFGKENHPETIVDSRKLIVAIKNMKEKLYQDNF
jgi:alpha-D-ribose 1-methylphosphonate 5-triphosphate synthase subunit PhnH